MDDDEIDITPELGGVIICLLTGAAAGLFAGWLIWA